ncbi:MAG: hypothetical protein K2J39_01010 [Ruminococcus sp.]|nr:hypothetical protein [Ruminococcus sp.]
MITPFASAEAFKIVRKIAGTSKSKVVKNIEEHFKNLSMGTRLNSKKIDIDDAYIIWVYACIFDDIAYNRDYSSYCLHKGKSYSEKYIKARENIREEFNRKKILSGKYIYDRVNILSYITFNLQLVAGLSPSYKSELMKQMNRQSRSVENEFKKTLNELDVGICRWYDTFNK